MLQYNIDDVFLHVKIISFIVINIVKSHDIYVSLLCVSKSIHAYI
jgi:hypothetical protein